MPKYSIDGGIRAIRLFGSNRGTAPLGWEESVTIKLMNSYLTSLLPLSLRGESKRGEASLIQLFPPSPYQGEGDKGDRVTKNKG